MTGTSRPTTVPARPPTVDSLVQVWAPLAEVVFLAAAGTVAGVASSSGAIGSLISYPALLAVGIGPLAANVSNAVAVVGVGISSSLRSRVELEPARDHLPRWALCAASGAAVGAALLLLSPGGFFDWVVPFLVLFAAATLFFQPRILARRNRRISVDGAAAPDRLLPLGLFGVAVYEGYFGAASGVMMLALLMVTVEVRLVYANAVKNALLGVADLVAAAAFIIFGPVHWLAAIPLGLGFLAGGSVGPSVVRRVRADVLRVAISAAGLALAGWLLVEAVRG